MGLFLLSWGGDTSSTSVVLTYLMRFMYFESLAPAIYKKCHKDLLKCEACELAKHTRSVYPVSGKRSAQPFDLVHSDVWGPTKNASTNGCHWYVTFINCYSRTTWHTLLKAKSDVFSAFKTFYTMIKTQFGTRIKAIRTDNGTEYTNAAFQNFLRTHGVVHQRTRVNTPAQNGVCRKEK